MFYHMNHGRVVRTALPSPRPKREEKTVTTTQDNGTPKKGHKGGGKYLKQVPKLADRIRIVRWLDGRKNELLAERPRYAKVAEDVKKELLIDISEDGLRNTCKAAGVYWKEVHARSENKSKAAPHHNNTRNTLTLLRAQVKALRQSVLILCSRIGETPPDVVTDALWPVMTTEDLEPTEVANADA